MSVSSARSSAAAEIPHEILRTIFIFAIGCSNVDSPHEPPFNSFLAVLASVNMCWKHAAYALLYGNLSLLWRYRKVQLLLRTFEANPSLLRLVTSFEVAALTSYRLGLLVRKPGTESRVELDELGQLVRSSLTESTTSLYRDRFRKMKVEHPDAVWMAENEDANGLLEVTTEACTELQSLIVRFPRLIRFTASDFPTIPNIPALTSTLNHLTFLELDDVPHSILPDILARTPNLTCLAFSPSPEEPTLEPSPPPFFHFLRHLKLPILATTYLQSLLTAQSPSLLTLTLSTDFPPSPSTFTAQHMVDTLLEYLSIDLSRTFGVDVPSTSDIQRVISTCENLQILKVVNVSLVEILPTLSSSKLSTIDHSDVEFIPSPVTLRAHHDSPEVLVPKVLANSSHLRSLKRVHLHLPMHSPENSNNVNALEKLPLWEAEAEARGIELKIDWKELNLFTPIWGAFDRSIQEWRTGGLI